MWISLSRCDVVLEYGFPMRERFISPLMGSRDVFKIASCSKCGAPLDPNAQFCASCGNTTTPQAAVSPFSSPPPAPSSYSSNSVTPATMQRPTGVTILAVLAFLGGVILLAFGVSSGSILSLFLPGLGVGVEILFVVFALIQFAIGYGFWTGATWAWWLGIIGALLDIVSIVGANVFGFVIGIVMLYYLMRPHVKMWFRKA